MCLTIVNHSGKSQVLTTHPPFRVSVKYQPPSNEHFTIHNEWKVPLRTLTVSTLALVPQVEKKNPCAFAVNTHVRDTITYGDNNTWTG